ncbi:hypothetical protein MSG28_013981 [Choristoneura fumiferana]|uniref:Uncharacterized protein n=1 Tax=Choristoneura fumiferana TaxID=7141 RepID=A0ACC0K9W3_CHOFU|nr:hypothetical protein MSG28_013981 [Choristoneura fumiferana]
MGSLDEPKAVKLTYLAPLLAGAVAGISVDVALYPLDTLKTRLQSSQGFQKAGGFRGVYKAGGFAAAATTPLDLAKTRIMLAPEYTATRKLRVQPVLRAIYRESGLRGLFAGCTPRFTAFMAGGFVFFGVYDDCLAPVAIASMPGAALFFVSYETAKALTEPLSACCGAAAAIVAGTVTTPFDVAKTRIILAEVEHTSAHSLRIQTVLRVIYREAGLRGLFAGCTTRVIALMLGSFVFFGVYEEVKSIVEKKLKDQGTI